MKAGEIQVLKDLVDVEMAKLVQAECERLPVAYQPAVKAIMAALQPAIQQALDKMIEGIPVDPA